MRSDHRGDRDKGPPRPTKTKILGKLFEGEVMHAHDFETTLYPESLGEAEIMNKINFGKCICSLIEMHLKFTETNFIQPVLEFVVKGHTSPLTIFPQVILSH